jgi:hypothetical protein
MAIKINNTTVIDNSCNITNATDITASGTITAGAINLPVTGTTFSPADNATGVPVTTNQISITFNQIIEKGTGNITLRSGSASGTVIQTISVGSGSVTVSGATLIIITNDFNYSTNVYVVIDAGAIVGAFQSNTIINTYNFTTVALNLGDSYGGGNLICKANPVRWITAPSAAEISTNWFNRNSANTCAQTISGCSGWFVPTITQLQNPGSVCRAYWQDPKGNSFWSNSDCGYFYTIGRAWRLNLSNGNAYCVASKTNSLSIRSFRCVTY